MLPGSGKFAAWLKWPPTRRGGMERTALQAAKAAKAAWVWGCRAPDFGPPTPP